MGGVRDGSDPQRLTLVDVTGLSHRLAADGSHVSELVTVPGLPTLSIAEFPQAYGAEA